MAHCITLTTDFGLTDWFVGAMKGVIHEIAPKAAVIDLTHGVSSGDIRAGAFALLSGFRTFPHGTIHVTVIDPGVGSEREAIGVKTSDYTFIGPNNGVLSWALSNLKVLEIRKLNNPSLFRQPISQTFHGRDIFAPVAAHLACGTQFEKIGPELKDFQRLPWPEINSTPEGTAGEVIYIDRFGNALTNIPAAISGSMQGVSAQIISTKKVTVPLVKYYAAVKKGKPLAIAGSSGFLEIAVNGGSAASKLNLKPGARVLLRNQSKD